MTLRRLTRTDHTEGSLGRLGRRSFAGSIELNISSVGVRQQWLLHAR
jgi:hypothetical protein